MGSFLEPQVTVDEKVKYPDYFLGENPFPSKDDLTEGDSEGEDFNSLFCHFIYDKEINNIINSILNSSKQGKKKFWLIKNDKLNPDHNISVVTGLFRALTILPSPRIFSAYVPFPVIVREPLGGILQWCSDRLNVERFRLCVYAFVYNELTKMKDTDEAGEKLPSFDISDLLQKMNETKGEALDEILFVAEPQEMEVEVETEEEPGQAESADENQEVSNDQKTPEEKAGEAGTPENGDTEEAEARRIEFEKKKALRNEFVLAIESKVAASSFSPQVKSALAVAITEGYEKGRSYIGLGEYRATLKSLLSLIALFHEKAVVILDRLDNWDMLDETQQAAMIGTLSELDWLFGQVGILVLASYQRTIEMIGGDFGATFEKLPIDLWPVTLDLKAPLPADKAVDLISYFLQSDTYRREKKTEPGNVELEDMFPFTEDGINQLRENAKDDIGEFLIAAGILLEKGQAEQHAVIDSEFVKKHGF